MQLGLQVLPVQLEQQALSASQELQAPQVLAVRQDRVGQMVQRVLPGQMVLLGLQALQELVERQAPQDLLEVVVPQDN